MSTITYSAETEEKQEGVNPKTYSKTMSMMMSLIIFVIVMMFAAWSSAYIVSMSSGFWAYFKIPAAFNISTGIIVLCSVTIYAALHFAKRNKQKALLSALVLTFILGIAFGSSQLAGWRQMTEQGHFVQGGLFDIVGVYGEDHVFYYKGEELVHQDDQFFLPSDTQKAYAVNDELQATRNTASSYFYVLSFMHLVHVVLGMGLLVYVLVKALKGHYNKEHVLGVKLTGIYWHFMGGLWIYILLFLHFIH